MIYFVGLWGNVLPGLLLVLLVWQVSERFEPGYGTAAAVVLGLGTLVLPLSTLLFSHVFTAFLGFAAFALMLRERDGPPSTTLLALAGLAMGYAVASEYPLFFVAVVLGLFLLSRRDALNPTDVIRRAGAYIVGGIVGIIPLLLYNHYAFHSWTHLAYSDVPRQKTGFFGIGLPTLRVFFTLLFDSRGLLTISPVLIMAAVGTVMLYRRGRRAEALSIGGICLCYVGYNSGYYLPFGGGFMGPRFLTTMLPFLACPLGLALKRFPGPTIALAAVSITTTVLASITHPLVGYENETVVWARYLGEGLFQPTIASAFGLGRSWGWSLAVLPGGRRRRRAGGLGHPAAATDEQAVGRRRAGAPRLGPVCGARAHAAGDRPPGAAEHRRGRRSHGLEPQAPRRQPLSAADPGSDRRGRRSAGAARDGARPKCIRRGAQTANGGSHPGRLTAGGGLVPGHPGVAFGRVKRFTDDDVAGPWLFTLVGEARVEARPAVAAGPVVDVETLDLGL